MEFRKKKFKDGGWIGTWFYWNDAELIEEIEEAIPGIRLNVDFFCRRDDVYGYVEFINESIYDTPENRATITSTVEIHGNEENTITRARTAKKEEVNKNVRNTILAKYSIQDELKIQRQKMANGSKPSAAFIEYNDYIDGIPNGKRTKGQRIKTLIDAVSVEGKELQEVLDEIEAIDATI